MEFRVLGPLEVSAGSQTCVFGQGRRRRILGALLAADGAAVSTDRLIDQVWEGDPPETARKSLQSHLSRLRDQLRSLEPSSEPLVTEPEGYRLDLDRHPVDAARFERLVGEAADLIADDPERAVALLDEALDLWRGRAYGELADLAGIRVAALRLEQLRANAEADRIDARLALGQHTGVIGDLRRAIAADPMDERAHRQLMLALYRSGRQREALAVSQQLSGRLAEVGMEPSPAVRHLEEQILRHDPGVAAPSPAGPEPASVRSQPSTGTHQRAFHLIGRDDDVTEVAELIAPGGLLTLTGPGGVGKTRLADRAADLAADRFEDGVAFVGLASIRDPDNVGEALITSLGIQPTGEQAAPETLVRALGERRLLLLLDNCEHLLEAVAPLVELVLGRCPEVAILATSRERLRVAGERLWPVRPLAVPDADAAAGEVQSTPAGSLFCLRATEAEPGFDLTDADAPAVAELCRRLDGMPLAIELAAARIRALTPGDLVDRLGQRFSLLAGGPRHEGGRHRTLESVVAWSYDLLDPREATLFDRLSVFAGSFSVQAAEQVGAGDGIAQHEVAGLLGELVDKSMVVVDRRRGSVRYRLLDTLRQFGSRRLAEDGNAEALRRRHACYHVQLAERLGPKVRGPEEPEAVAGIDAAFPDLRAAHTWAVDTGETEAALRLPGALADYAFYRLRDEVTTWARRAVSLPGAATHPSYAAALGTAAYGATSRDECTRARRDATEVLRHADPDSVAALWGVGGQGVAALYEGRLDDLLVCADQLVEAATRLQVPFYVAFSGVLRVIGHTYRGEEEAALAALGDLDRAADDSGSPTMRAFARYCRGEALLDSKPAEGAAALEEAVELARGVDNALIEGVSMVSLASLRGRLGDTEAALAQFRRIVVHWRNLGDHTHQLTTLRNLVVLLAEIGADEAAAVLYGAVIAGLTPSFGLEAERLDAAWEAVEERLGADAAGEALRRGRALGPTQLSSAAIRYLDELG